MIVIANPMPSDSVCIALSLSFIIVIFLLCLLGFFQEMWWRELERAVSQFVNDVADYFPVEEVDGALGTGCILLGVSHHDDGGAFGIEFLEELHDLPSVLGVEVAGGLVGEDELRV